MIESLFVTTSKSEINEAITMPCTGSWQKAATPGDGYVRASN